MFTTILGVGEVIIRYNKKSHFKLDLIGTGTELSLAIFNFLGSLKAVTPGLKIPPSNSNMVMDNLIND